MLALAKPTAVHYNTHMTLRQYLILMTIGTLACWIAWFFVIGNISPAEAGILGFAFFYLSLFLAIVGTFSVAGFLTRRVIIKNDNIVFRHVHTTFRQSIIIASLIIISLLLLSQHLLAWWNALLLVALFFILEGMIFSNRKYRNLDYVK